jgi:cell division protease FtsH
VLSPGSHRPTAPRRRGPDRPVKRTGALIAVLAAAVLWSAPGHAAADDTPPTTDVHRASSSSRTAELSLATLLARARGGQVVNARIDDLQRTVSGELAGGGSYRTEYPVDFADELTSQLLAAGADVSMGEAPTGDTASPAGPLVFLLVVATVLVAVLVLRAWRHRSGDRSAAGPGRAGPERSPAAGQRPDALGKRSQAAEGVTPPATRFADVAGAEEPVAELRELVDFLRKPERFVTVGARLPSGYLLVGPPGTGKTLLARAVAGEAGVPFFAAGGAQFVEKYVGVGAARVRALFQQARKAGKAIVFVDEIDAIGKTRASESGPGVNEEREHALNQLLIELDGFQQSDVVVLAATNRPDTLDAALLRPGRFDRQITVPAPDRRGRAKILRLHMADRALGPEVDLELLAQRTPGFTGADLANLANQAALVAVRYGAAAIGPDHVDEALATVVLGPARRSLEVAERDRRITAWHEAGHALAGLLLPDATDPVQVTIVPRGAAGGATWFPDRDELFITAGQARAQLVVALGGRAAEEQYLGADFTQGAAHDLKTATQLAQRMVTEFGMSVLGARHVTPAEYQIGPLAESVHGATRELLDAAMADARALLAKHQGTLQRLVEMLLDQETVDLAALRGLVGSTADSASGGEAVK